MNFVEIPINSLGKKMEFLGWAILLLCWITLILRKFIISGEFYSFWGISPSCFNLPQNITFQNHLSTSAFPKLRSMMLWVKKVKKQSNYHILWNFTRIFPKFTISLYKRYKSPKSVSGLYSSQKTVLNWICPQNLSFSSHPQIHYLNCIYSKMWILFHLVQKLAFGVAFPHFSPHHPRYLSISFPFSSFFFFPPYLPFLFFYSYFF